MRVTVETITPALAAKMLEKNTRNRHLRPTLVSQYARDMREGRWMKTHQGIAINCDGTLLDGQHRLAAIVEAGIPQEFTVARGVPSESQIVMDDHIKRSAPDALSIDRGESVSQMTVAVIRGILVLGGGNRRAVTKPELSGLLDTFSEPLGFIAPFVTHKQRGVTTAAVWAAVVLAWFYVRDLDRLADFCRALCGQDMATDEGDKAAITLREWLLRTGAHSAGMRTEAFGKTQRAIVAFMGRKAIGKLYGTTVHYPWPLVDPVR